MSDIFDDVVLAGIKENNQSLHDGWTLKDFRGLLSIINHAIIAAWRLHCFSKTWLQEDPLRVPPPPEILCTAELGSWKELPDEKFHFDCESLTRISAKTVTSTFQAAEKGMVTVNLGMRAATAQQEEKSVRLINELYLTVTDTGKGMDEDYLCQRISRPFQGVDEDETTGLSLSLSICSALFARLGGRIQISSRPGRGSYFDYVFPCRGWAASSVAPTKIKVTALASRDRDQARHSFLLYCERLS